MTTRLDPPPDCCVCDPGQTVRVCWCHTGEVLDKRPCQCSRVGAVWPETIFDGERWSVRS